MSKKLQKSQVVETTTVQTPVAAPVADKKVKKLKQPKESELVAVKTEQVKVEPVAITQESTSESAPETPVASLSVEFAGKLSQLAATITTLKAEYRALEKRWLREVKAAQKVSSKRKRKSGNRAPSGFVKPAKISDELADFLGKSKGSEMARTEVTREINNYIREKKLQDKDNGRKIIPDAKLTALLKLKKDDELTYFNLQRYMSPHFAKAVKVTV